MAYNPPTRVVQRDQPYLSLVTSVDPYWARGKFYEREYEFSGRVVYYNGYVSGAYGRRDNAYPVGSQQGGLDPLIIDNLAPTEGVATPGLFEGVPDGKGWG